MSAPFAKVHHICVAVHDIEAAIAYYESVGIGPWHDYPPLSEFVELDVPNPDAFRQLRYRWTDLENVQLQLCQPPRLDCAQRRFLDAHGEGVFHLGFEAVLADAVPQAKAAGLDVLMSGRRENGTGFTYYDTLDRTGVVWMNRQTRP